MSFFDCNEKLMLMKKKTTHFGDNRYSNYIIHKDDERKNRYIDRHKKREKWNRYWTPGSLSRYILWNEKTLYKSMFDYSRKFNLTMLQNKMEIEILEQDMKKTI